ncbi:MAG: FKBP-type peptidyl-prolyl cis-trans isomerase [Bacteroidetes bacterium]|nr:FKBP-type peptidyl-prolyl cis-trans isomerase [Bacteroidota bacterium]
MKQTLNIGILLLVLGLAACHTQKKISTADKPFVKSPTGVEYKFLYDAPGAIAKEGNFVELHISTFYNDSAIFNSRTMGTTKPVVFPLSAPKFHGDLAEVIGMMSPGDSLMARVSVDSMKKNGQRTQPWMKDGGMITYRIYLISVKTQEQINADRDKETSGQLAQDDKILQDYFVKNNIKPMKTASGLYYVITKPGAGADAKPGQVVSVNYTGHRLDGKVFDSNLDPKFNHVEPIVFELGKGKVIRGWDEGVGLLNKTAKATFYIPSPLAYGTNSPSADIPANSILIFDVELLDIR